MADAPRKRPGPGRPKDHELAGRRRAEIVAHAIAEFARRGYAGADLDAIAAAAGCSKGTLYNYFASKAALFGAAVDHVMAEMKRTLDPTEGGDAIGQIEHLVRGFLRYFAEHPQHVELLVQERSDFRDRSDPAYTQYRAASRDAWKNRFEAMIAAGEMRDMPADRAINILGDLLYGTIFLNHFRGRQPNPAGQAEEILDVLLGGLLTPRARRAWLEKHRHGRAGNED